MRKREEVLNKLITFANENKNIRAMVLQGSHINAQAPKDIFSDLDPLFYCEDVKEFTECNDWKNYFGDVISYFHDAWDMKDNKKGYTRLTIYSDGFKLDFGFQDVSLAKYANDMELYKVYVDKDHIVPKPEVTDDRKFFVKKPLEQEYQDILRDFFFDSSYVIKTIYREEVTFNQYMMYILHKKINQLLTWYVGTKHNFNVNVGVYNRYIKQYLTKEEWKMLEQTYSNADKQSTYQALLDSFTFVHYLGVRIADMHGFTYPQKHEDDMLDYCTEMYNTYIRPKL